MTNFTAGSNYLLDGKEEVTIVKSVNKASTKYVVETQGRSVIIVEAQRLSLVQQPALVKSA